MMAQNNRFDSQNENVNNTIRPVSNVSESESSDSLEQLLRMLKRGVETSGNRMLALLAILLFSINFIGIWVTQVGGVRRLWMVGATGTSVKAGYF